MWSIIKLKVNKIISSQFLQEEIIHTLLILLIKIAFCKTTFIGVAVYIKCNFIVANNLFQSCAFLIKYIDVFTIISLYCNIYLSFRVF